MTSATQDVTPINVTTLPDGTLTYSVTLTNAAGEAIVTMTATALLETVAPAGYTMTPDATSYNLVTGKSAGFTVDIPAAYVGVGDTLNYLVGGLISGAVGGSGAVTNTTQDVTPIDITSFSPGQITFVVWLSDAAGNKGFERSWSFPS